MFRFAVVDDHPIMRNGLKEVIQARFHDATIDEFGAGYEFIWNLQQNDYDLVLLDISLGDLNGIEALQEIKKKRPKLPVLIVSMYPEQEYAIRAIRAGASGYVSKRSVAAELVQAMQKALAGQRYVSPAFAEKMLIDFETDSGKNPHEQLSARELQVLVLIGRGKTVKQIAEDLRLSADTIRTYRARILQKLSLKGTSQLVHYAVTKGLTQ